MMNYESQARFHTQHLKDENKLASDFVAVFLGTNVVLSRSCSINSLWERNLDEHNFELTLSWEIHGEDRHRLGHIMFNTVFLTLVNIKLFVNCYLQCKLKVT